jgi:hypothetical protein
VAEPFDVIHHHVCDNPLLICALARYDVCEDGLGLVASAYETLNGLTSGSGGLQGLIIHIYLFTKLHA